MISIKERIETLNNSIVSYIYMRSLQKEKEFICQLFIIYVVFDEANQNTIWQIFKKEKYDNTVLSKLLLWLYYSSKDFYGIF